MLPGKHRRAASVAILAGISILAPLVYNTVRNLASENDYAALATRYGVRRTDYRFWSHSDALLVAYRGCAPIEAALFDYNHFENR